MHKLLQRQINSLRKKSSDGNHSIDQLLEIVGKTYSETDEDRKRVSHTMQLMSEELLTLNRQILKENETYVSTIMENVVDGIVTYGEDGIVLSFNGAMEKIFKLPRNEVIGQQIGALSPPNEKSFPAIYELYFSHGQSKSVYETVAQNKLGKDFPIELTISKMSTQRGIIFIAIVRDITERTTHQKALIEAKESALQTAQLKTNFLSTMSHEIRTPMNAVIGLTNLLLQESPREDQLENLKTLKFSGENLLVLINDILDYNKIEADKLKIEQVEFNLIEVISNIKKSLKMRAQDKGISLHILTETGLPQLVIGDPTRLSQVLLNLVGNAIKFTENGSVTLTVKLQKTAENTDTINFAIEDTGIGIPETQINLIFDNFTQSNSSITRKYGGTGLGLAISKRLVELQNSTIQVKSKPGHGSTFSFTLQFDKSKNINFHSESITEEQETIEYFDSFDILLVEDNIVNQMVATKFLTKWGLNVDVAENGRIAIEKVKGKDYATVLMDLQMPVMDGYTAAKTIRELPGTKYQQLPIIALTASTRAVENAHLDKIGINSYISKPFNPLDLNQTIAHFISSK